MILPPNYQNSGYDCFHTLFCPHPTIFFLFHLSETFSQAGNVAWTQRAFFLKSRYLILVFISTKILAGETNRKNLLTERPSVVEKRWNSLEAAAFSQERGWRGGLKASVVRGASTGALPVEVFSRAFSKFWSWNRVLIVQWCSEVASVEFGRTSLRIERDSLVLHKGESLFWLKRFRRVVLTDFATVFLNSPSNCSWIVNTLLIFE